LPVVFTGDGDRRARFEREARVLASLNHPHIGAIYGLEESQGTSYLVLELVDGITLAERIAKGPLSLSDSLDIARQITDALEAAHEKGIVHRDLKPANIKLTADQKVKVLDFGLAKLSQPSDQISTAPTETIATRDGAVFGTPGYMSPEQARGEPVDKRADVWAFGCVLYEMLTGKPAFVERTVSDTIAALLSREPDWTALPHAAGPELRRVLRRCIEKDPKRRLHDIADVGIELDDAIGPIPSRASDMSLSPHRVWRLAAVAMILVLVGGLVTIAYFRQQRPNASEVRLEITTPPTADEFSLAVSPDGQAIAFVATTDNVSRLWLRPLAGSARPLVGTDGAAFPFWSPDSHAIGFFADGYLKRVNLAGGPPQVVAAAVNGRGGAWGDDGTIVFTPSATSGLFRVSANGGEPAEITKLATPHHYSHRFPDFLPDGRRFIFFVRGSPDAKGIYLSSIDGSEMKRLVPSDSAGVVLPSGHLLFVRAGTLLVQPFELSNLSVSGDPKAVAEGVFYNIGLDLAAMTASNTGLLAYRLEGAAARRQLVWFDRLGREIERVGAADLSMWSPTIAPDRHSLALYRIVSGNADIWLFDTARDTLRRLTTALSAEAGPLWTPDGKAIVFGSNRKGVVDLYRKEVGGSETEQVLLQSSGGKSALDWSPDGQYLLYSENTSATGTDLWIMPNAEPRRPFAFATGPLNQVRGEFAPDGNWIAYDSNESGRFEIYIQSFPQPGEKHQVSTSGGAQPRWSRNGHELFYIAPDGGLMAAAIAWVDKDHAPTVRSLQRLFAKQMAGGPVPGPETSQYVVSDDGQRFLINTVLEESGSPITVVLNWRP
jgi:eukaryotic-like serine/threonine-protein kinase